MNLNYSCAATVLVADALPEDYLSFVPLAEAGELDLHFFTSGKAALRAAGQQAYDLWLVNVELPDIGGFDLLEMLSVYRCGTPVLAVADRYDLDAEREALALGVTKFLCKPIQPEWLVDLRLIRAATGSAQRNVSGLRPVPENRQDSMM